MAVAADTPILVSTGSAQPIRLGAKLSYDPAKDNAIHIWDWQKSRDSRPLPVAKRVGVMAVSPDGKWIVTGDGRLIEVASGAVKQLDNFTGDVQGLLFSPDGETLLLTVRKADRVSAARVLDFPSARKRFEVEGVWWYTFAGAFSPESANFYLMDKDRFLHRWDARTGNDRGRYEPAFSNSIRAIAVSADTKRLAAAASEPIDTFLWDRADGKLLHRLPPTQKHAVYSDAGISALAFSPDGKLLAGAGLYSVVLWETDTGKVSRLLPKDSGNTAYLRFSRDGKTLTTISGFAGVGEQRDNLVMYPSVREWDSRDR
jgi:WD40 repeat protein